MMSDQWSLNVVLVRRRSIDDLEILVDNIFPLVAIEVENLQARVR